MTENQNRRQMAAKVATMNVALKSQKSRSVSKLVLYYKNTMRQEISLGFSDLQDYVSFENVNIIVPKLTFLKMNKQSV